MATVLRPRGATVVFRTVKRPGSILPRGMDTIPFPTCPPHSSTAVLGTQLRCRRYLKSQQNKALYFPRRPQRFEPLSKQHTHGFAVTLENHRLLSLERVAPPPRSLVCCGGWFVCLHTQQPRVHLMSQRQGTSMLSGTPKKFDLRFEGKVSPNVLQV